MYRKKSFVYVAVTILTVVLFVIILGYALCAAPIADDWGFYTLSRENSFWKVMETCMNSTGRVGQWLVIFTGFRFLGMNAVRIMPIVMFVSIGVLLSWLAYNLKLTKEKRDCLIIGFLTAEVGTLLLPSVFDSFLWFDSAATGYASIAALLLVVNMCCYFIKKRPRMVWELLFYVVVMLSATFSEFTSLLMIGGLGLVSILALAFKRKDIYRYSIPFCLAALVGFLVLYFSPGSINRRIVNTHEFSLEWIFIDSFKNIASNVVHEFSVWEFGILAVCCVFVASRTQLNASIRKRYKMMIVAAIVFLFGVIYGTVCANNYIQAGTPYRIYTLPCFGAVLALEALAIGIKYAIPARRRFQLNALSSSRAVGMFGGAVVGVICFGAIVSASSYTMKLNLRRQLVNYRDVNVAAQRDAGEDTIYVIEAPRLVTGNAEDVYYYYNSEGIRRIIWVGEHYASYMGVSDREVVLIAPPAMYTY